MHQGAGVTGGRNGELANTLSRGNRQSKDEAVALAEANAEMSPVLLTFATARRSSSSDLPNTLRRCNRNRSWSPATPPVVPWALAVALTSIVPALVTKAVAVLPASASCPTPCPKATATAVLEA